MKLLPSEHTVHRFRGGPKKCGMAYGESQAEGIETFLRVHVTPNAKRLRYAGRCWKVLEEWERHVVEFVRGVADGSGLTPVEVTLILLHEEIGHLKKCTAFGATGPGTRTGAPIIGQNWDWSSSLYPWSSLLRLRMDGSPATLTYGYPGLWAGAGINEHGVSLAWTSSGCFPRVEPKVGIPSYALIAGILACRNCQDALALLRRTMNAGCFIFLIADAGGEVWVIEGLPGKIEAEQCRDVVSRANHYECALSCQRSAQKLPRASARKNSRARARRMAELLDEATGRVGPRSAEAFLRDHGVRPGLNICQHQAEGRSALTLDSLYMLPASRELRIARGVPCRHRFKSYRV